MSELVIGKHLMPMLKQAQPRGSQSEMEADRDPIFSGGHQIAVPVALRAATTYSDERVAEALGGYLPALLRGDAEQDRTIESWHDYESWLESSEGKCCEPTAPGWAACTYLWRLASSLPTTWLFERESLRPLLSEPEYVAVLDQMSKSVKKSVHANQGLTPEQIYEEVASGRLVGGIGFPRHRSDQSTSVPISLSALPRGNSQLDGADTSANREFEHRSTVLDPFMLVSSLSAACRQTAAATVFLNWIAGGPGSETLYQDIAPLIDTRSAAKETSSNAFESYRGWVISQLNRANFLPTLDLPGAAEYYQTLDQGVRACVHGDQNAREACADITDHWVRLHHQYDLPSQQRAWKRMHGI